MGCDPAPMTADGGRTDAPGADGGSSDVGVNSDGGPTDAGGGSSSGCGAAPSIAVGEWVSQSLTVGGAERSYFVRLPEGYDEDRAYPIVYQLHGCSDSATREDKMCIRDRA